LDNINEDKLVVNLFRINQTKQRLLKNNVRGEKEAKDVHYEVGKNVLTPSLYKLIKDNTNNEDLTRFKKWTAETVNRILRNEIYTRTLIQNIKTKPNYRIDKLIDVNKAEWIITENHHEPIINKNIFYEVQQILNRKILNELINTIYIIDKNNIKLRIYDIISNEKKVFKKLRLTWDTDLRKLYCQLLLNKCFF